MNENINSKLSLRDLDEKKDLGEVEKRTKEKTEQTAYIQDVTNRSESIIGNLIDKSILLDFTR